MMMRYLLSLVSLAVIILLLNACTNSDVDKESYPFEGEWNAQWDTNPAGFPDVARGSPPHGA